MPAMPTSRVVLPRPVCVITHVRALVLVRALSSVRDVHLPLYPPARVLFLARVLLHARTLSHAYIV